VTQGTRRLERAVFAAAALEIEDLGSFERHVRLTRRP